MQQIKKKHRNGCGVASAAMILGIDYDTALKYMHPRYEGQTYFDYSSRKYHFNRIFEIVKANYKIYDDKKFLSLKYPNILILDFRDVEENLLHAIVWEPINRTVFDPDEYYAYCLDDYEKKFKYNIKKRIYERIEVK